MSQEPIRYRNRYTGRIETELVYGEAWLRWAYGSPWGRLALRTFVVRPWFSRWYGWRMSRPVSRRRVQPFITAFGVDAAEFAEPAEQFRTFNEFFHRGLRPGARPVDPNPAAAVFPADGRHLGFPRLDKATAFFVKDQRFDLSAFLGDTALAERFAGGAAVFSRLCPVDYHRFHFPAACIPAAPRLVNGPLWSVNPIALRRNLAILWENRRWLGHLRTTDHGEILMSEIGATNVGSVRHTFAAGQPAPKGAEKGYFLFGGSAVLTLFEPGRIRLADDLAQSGAEGVELYARCGDTLGTFV